MEKQRLNLREALVLALPFLMLLLAYGLVTGKVNFNHWPPNVEMRIGFWWPVVWCAVIYFFLLMNLCERRKGTWKWYSSGLASLFIIIILWFIIAPIYEASVGRTERYKVGIDY